MSNDPPNLPIGVFDSGLGGLTVVRAIRRALPNESVLYLGDTARVPYGTRSPQTIVRYARACAHKLVEQGIKVLVVACNTVSAVALDTLSAEFDLPVIGVIGPGARAGVSATRKHRVAVLATQGTIASGAYPRAIAGLDSRTEVFAAAAPLLVPLVEEGWIEGEVPALVAQRYLGPIVASDVDVIILGCTHYPLLASVLQEQASLLSKRPIVIVDSAVATADELRTILSQRALQTTNASPGNLRLLVTDLPQRFSELAGRFLGEPVESTSVEQIDL